MRSGNEGNIDAADLQLTIGLRWLAPSRSRIPLRTCWLSQFWLCASAALCAVASLLSRAKRCRKYKPECGVSIDGCCSTTVCMLMGVHNSVGSSSCLMP